MAIRRAVMYSLYGLPTHLVQEFSVGTVYVLVIPLDMCLYLGQWSFATEVFWDKGRL